MLGFRDERQTLAQQKGARGQSEFKAMLLDRDWTVDTLTAGSNPPT